MSGLTMVQGPEAFQYAGLVQSLMAGEKTTQPLLYDYRFVMQKILDRSWQLWLFFEDDEPPTLMLVTWISQLPAGKLCFIELVCGEGRTKLFEKLEVFDNWCKFEQIDLVQMGTVGNVASFLAAHGWAKGSQMVHRWIERVQ